MNPKKSLAILIPAHNEATVINAVLQSVLKQLDKKDIYLVDDGSSDGTPDLAKKVIPNVLILKKNSGKAGALNQAIKHFKLTDRYKYIMPLDADTRIAPKFVEIIKSQIKLSRGKKVAAFVGRVTSTRQNWISVYRTWEYEVSHSIYKQAQSQIGAISVCPGCSTVYKSSVFNKINFPSDTVTEDMDFTYLIHRKKLGKILFVDQAQVITQDPKNLKDFIGQISRWYSGFWQCVHKYDIPWGGQKIDLEVAVLATEGLFNGFLTLTLFVLLPWILLNKPAIFLFPLVVDLWLFIVPTLLYTQYKRRSYRLIRYLFHIYILKTISSLVFLFSFLKVVASFNLFSWHKPLRYTIQ